MIYFVYYAIIKMNKRGLLVNTANRIIRGLDETRTT